MQVGYLTENELKTIGLKEYGYDVLIDRYALIISPEKIVIGNHVRVDAFATLNGNITLGNYIHISQFCGLYGGDAGIIMDDYSGLSSKCAVYASSDDYSGKSMTNPTVPMEFKPEFMNAPVRIHKHVIVGCGSVILPGVDIGEGSAIGSMSLCNHNIDSWYIYAGCPAKKIKKREKDIITLCNNLNERAEHEI